MKFKFLSLFLVLFFVLGFFVSCSGGTKNMQKVKFDRVVDGNTIKVFINDGLNDVRLLLVDAPELRGGYPFSHESKKYIKDKLKVSEELYLDTDNTQKDKYGKILAYVWYYDNEKNLKLLNKDVVYEGFGRVVEDGTSVKHLDELKASQEDAKLSKRNIWSLDGYVTDDGYKKIELEE